MQLARVIGQVVSTVKDPGLGNLSLIVLRGTGEDARPDGPSYVAVDLVGAGDGDLVLVVTGSGARVSAQVAHAPTDCTVVGIVDSVIHEGHVTYRSTYSTA